MSCTSYDIIERRNDNLHPVMAMVVYKSDKDYTYIETHSIDENGKMTEGIPLSYNCISELAGSFSQEQIEMPHGKVPENLLFFDNRIGFSKYIWYQPPKKQMMYFVDELGIPDGEYFIPGIIYVVYNDSMDIYAFKGDKPIDELYKAPFFNTTDASVCLGNADLSYPENPSYFDFMDYWEKKFWLTKFSHLGGSKNPTKDNLVHVTKKSKRKFDFDQLIKSNKKLKQLFS